MMGALQGATKWGIISALGAVGCYFASPLFRGLTIQFRVYLWMCPTTIGSMMEADRCTYTPTSTHLSTHC
ncbi:hypothetical protein BDD12DRAFT_843611 [Trichophaea hybrida]|nr:hypothetical protein BDD12DRAFT_843611 [Trichophaea hybrida]